MQIHVVVYFEEILRDFGDILVKRFIEVGIPEDKAREYVSILKQNDIDPSLFGEMNDQTLQTIGINSLGHRMKILKIFSSWPL